MSKQIDEHRKLKRNKLTLTFQGKTLHSLIYFWWSFMNTVWFNQMFNFSQNHADCVQILFVSLIISHLGKDRNKWKSCKRNLLTYAPTKKCILSSIYFDKCHAWRNIRHKSSIMWNSFTRSNSKLATAGW